MTSRRDHSCRSDGVDRTHTGNGPVTRDALLAVRGIVKRFGGVCAVDGASLDIPEGTIVGLIGPNGAGKSTLVNIVAGELSFTSGRVTFNTFDVTGWPSHRLAKKGLIRTFQIPGYFPSLSVLDNLLAGSRGGVDTLWRALLGPNSWKKQESRSVSRARILLDRFHMSAKEAERADRLSGGQKRLLEIMRALMEQPKLLLMDEPFAGVTPTLIDLIEDELRRLRDEGITVVIVEHNLQLIERLCDFVAVMAKGKVISKGTMMEVRADERVRDAYLV
jgi:ABC-type branched-subunit amino acid transport system ATPase component